MSALDWILYILVIAICVGTAFYVWVNRVKN